MPDDLHANPHAPPHRTRVVPGGYTISTEFLDAIEAIHQMWLTKNKVGPTSTQREVGRLDLERREVESIRGHLARRHRQTRDNLLKSGITKRVRFKKAAAGLGYELPKIAKRQKQKRALRATTEAVIGWKLLRRDHRRILRVAVLTALWSEKGEPRRRYHRKAKRSGSGRVRQRHVPPRATHADLENDGTTRTREVLLGWEAIRKSKKKWKSRRTRREKATLEKRKRWEVVQRSRIKGQRSALHIDSGTDRLRAMTPWLVPPWGSARKGNNWSLGEHAANFELV